MITSEILIIAGLLLLNAFFALSEMAIVSASKPVLRQMARQGNRRAGRALALAENSGRFLSTVQVGITLVGILAGAYGGAEIADKLTPYFDTVAFIRPHGELLAVTLVVACITYFSVVIGELIPKQMALSKPEALAMWVARPMSLLSMLCTPVVVLLEGSANLFFRVLGIRRHAEKVTEMEVKAVIAEGAASGAIEKAEHDMLQRIIRLGERDVKSVMTHRTDVSFLDVNDGLDVVRRKIHESRHSHYPVLDGGTARVIGIVQTKELLDIALNLPGSLRLRDHLKEAIYLPETAKCLSVLDIFKKSSVHMAVVVDEYGVTVGVVTAVDLLEAIVGIIRSNYDENDEPMIVQRKDGSWLVDGSTSIHEIHLAVGLEELDADKDVDTIAGFMLHLFGHTPQAGERVEQFGHRFEVMDMDGRRIDKILIEKLPQHSEP